MNNILITICARGGSKGIPGKNIKLINGKPLLAYTIKHAKKIAQDFNADIALSTDSIEIKKVAKDFGIITEYVRSSYLASDTAGKLDVIKDILLYEERNRNYNYIIDLDVTSPLRTIKDINDAYYILKKDSKALNIFSVSQAKRSPYFNMVEKKNNGYFSLVKKGKDILSRQKAPKVYDMNASFYIYKRKFFESNLKTAISEYSLIYLMDHICFDLDEPVDFLFMEYLLKNNLLDFEL